MRDTTRKQAAAARPVSAGSGRVSALAPAGGVYLQLKCTSAQFEMVRRLLAHLKAPCHSLGFDWYFDKAVAHSLANAIVDLDTTSDLDAFIVREALWNKLRKALA